MDIFSTSMVDLPLFNKDLKLFNIKLFPFKKKAKFCSMTDINFIYKFQFIEFCKLFCCHLISQCYHQDFFFKLLEETKNLKVSSIS